MDHGSEGREKEEEEGVGSDQERESGIEEERKGEDRRRSDEGWKRWEEVKVVLFKLRLFVPVQLFCNVLDTETPRSCVARRTMREILRKEKTSFESPFSKFSSSGHRLVALFRLRL